MVPGPPPAEAMPAAPAGPTGVAGPRDALGPRRPDRAPGWGGGPKSPKSHRLLLEQGGLDFLWGSSHVGPRRNAATPREQLGGGREVHCGPRSVAQQRPGGRSLECSSKDFLGFWHRFKFSEVQRCGDSQCAVAESTAAFRPHRGSISEEARGELWHSSHSSPASVGPGREKELSKLSKQGASTRRAGRGNACSVATWPARSRPAGALLPGVRVRVYCEQPAATVRATGRRGRRPRRPWTRTRTRSGPGWPGWSASCRPTSRRARRRAS